jgi:hypothetical protein
MLLRRDVGGAGRHARVLALQPRHFLHQLSLGRQSLIRNINEEEATQRRQIDEDEAEADSRTQNQCNITGT